MKPEIKKLLILNLPYEEKTRPCYAVGAENPLICRAFRA